MRRDFKRGIKGDKKPDRFNNNSRGDVQTITAGEAAEWERWLRKSGSKKGGPLTTNTVRDRVKKAKQFFNVAMDYELIDRNALAKLAGNIAANKDRQFL